MKTLLTLGIISFALSFCGIADRFTGGDTDTTGTTTESDTTKDIGSGSGGDEVETAKLTSEMEALLDGDKATWEEQGIVWKLPKGWSKGTVSKTSLQYGTPSTGFLIGTISSLGKTFPTDISRKAFYDKAVEEAKEGKYEKVQYLSISGIQGVETVQAMPEDKSDARRHQWIGYRTFNDQTQMVNIMVSTKGTEFDKKKDTFKAILYSMEVAN